MIQTMYPQSLRRRRVSIPLAIRAVVEAMEPRKYLSVSFEPPKEFSAGNNAVDGQMADLNGDGTPDLVAAVAGDSQVLVAFGDSTGALDLFAGYPLNGVPTSVALGDLNGNGRPDIVVGLADGGVDVLLNLGDGTFAQAARTPTAGTEVQRLIVVDANGDGALDAVATLINPNAVVVLPGDGNGGFNTGNTVDVDTTPAGIAVLDENADGAVELIVAEPTANQVSVRFLNTSGIVQRTDRYDFNFAPHSVKLIDMNKDNLGDLVVAGASGVSVLLSNGNGTFQPAAEYPVPGTVGELQTADIDGDTNLDVVLIDSTSGNGFVLPGDGAGLLGSAEQFIAPTNAVAVAVADVNGDEKSDLAVISSTSNSAILLNTSNVEPIPEEPQEPTDGPDLTVAIDRLTLPAVFTPGDRATAVVTVSNVGELPATGNVTIDLFVSTDTTLDETDVALNTGSAMVAKPINLATGRGKVFRGTFAVPEGLPVGDVYVLARVTTTDPAESDTTNNTAAHIGTFSSTNAFGQVGTRRNVKQIITDEDGSQVIFTLAGPGTGLVTRDEDGKLNVSLDGTTDRSRFVITPKGGDGATVVNDISLSGGIAVISAAKVDVTGDVKVGDGIRSLILRNVGSGASIDFTNGTVPVAVKLGNVADTSLRSDVPLKSLVVSSWTDTDADDTITAPYATTIKSTGDFSPSVILNGDPAAGPRGVFLKSASIVGNLTGGLWRVGGDLSTLVVRGSVAPSWTGVVLDRLGTFKVLGDFAGTVSATEAITAVAISGNMTNARVLAGTNLGADGELGGGDDVYTGAMLTRITVGVAVTNSLVAAGYDPTVDDGIDGNETLLPGGVIRAIVARGGADAQSKFLAETLPARVKLGTETVITLEDERFQLV